MLMLIWNNISRRRAQSVLTVAITTLTIMVFVMVMGIFQVVTQGLALSRERLGADAILVPKYASATGSDLLFTALPENSYMDVEVLEHAKQLEGIALLSMDSVIEMLREAFMLSPSVWNSSLALLCGGIGVALAAVLGFVASMTPAWKSAAMDPQSAITQGEVN